MRRIRRHRGRHARQVGGGRQVHDQGVGVGPLLRREDASHRGGVERVRAQAIHRLGREYDQAAGDQHASGLGDGRRIGRGGIDDEACGGARTHGRHCGTAGASPWRRARTMSSMTRE